MARQEIDIKTVEQCVQALKHGYTYQEIANEAGIAVSSVQNIKRRHNVQRDMTKFNEIFSK